MARSGPDTSGGTAPGPGAPVVIDCDDCAARGSGCRDCVVSVLIGVPESLSHDERAALEVLADVGIGPSVAPGAGPPPARIRCRVRSLRVDAPGAL